MRLVLILSLIFSNLSFAVEKCNWAKIALAPASDYRAVEEARDSLNDSFGKLRLILKQLDKVPALASLSPDDRAQIASDLMAWKNRKLSPAQVITNFLLKSSGDGHLQLR